MAIAWAIEIDGRYYFREGARTIPMERWEYERVIASPWLAYFTIALRFHLKVQDKMKNTPVNYLRRRY